MSDVILYKEDIDRLNSILQSLVGETKIISALLINKDTRLLASQGTLAMFDMSALAALIVGSFASSQAIAGLIGEREFGTMSHSGKSKNLLISLVDENTILATIFDKSIAFATVSACIEKHVETLKQALATIMRNMETLFQGPVPMPSLSQDDVEKGFDSFFDQPGAGAAGASLAAAAEKAPMERKQRDTQRVAPRDIPRPPETKQFEFERRSAQAAAELIMASEPSKTSPRSAAAAAMKRIPPPSNTEYLYFTSMNYLKNKAREGSTFQRHKHEKGIFSKLFSHSKHGS